MTASDAARAHAGGVRIAADEHARRVMGLLGTSLAEGGAQ
jgi:hypothetical protein